MNDYLRESLSYFGLFGKMLQVRKKYKPVRVSYGENKEQYVDILVSGNGK